MDIWFQTYVDTTRSKESVSLMPWNVELDLTFHYRFEVMWPKLQDLHIHSNVLSYDV